MTDEMIIAFATHQMESNGYSATENPGMLVMLVASFKNSQLVYKQKLETEPWNCTHHFSTEGMMGNEGDLCDYCDYVKYPESEF